jgi:hypothetical protein
LYKHAHLCLLLNFAHDDALGSACVDLVAVLALHLLAVAILAPGEAVDVAPDFCLWVFGLANVVVDILSGLNETPMTCGSYRAEVPYAGAIRSFCGFPQGAGVPRLCPNGQDCGPGRESAAPGGAKRRARGGRSTHRVG